MAQLARRDQSEREVRRALLRHACDEAEIDAAIVRLKEQGLLDDPAYAARYARSRLQHHGLGSHRIQQALRQKGVRRAAVQSGLKEALAEVSEAGSLDALARRYWQTRQREEPARRLRKLFGFLLRRGFPASLIDRRLRALWPRYRDVLEDVEPLELVE